MQWLNKIVEHVLAASSEDGEILIESGSSPSGTYHLGHIRELVTCDAILMELERRGRKARHIAYVDDLDGLRKIPVNVPADYEKYLGRSLCDIPAPDGSEHSYADYFTQGLIDFCQALAIDVQFVYAHQRYRGGELAPAIELSLDHIKEVRKILEEVSGHKMDETWSPIQVNEGGYLKKRPFINLDKQAKTLTYLDKDGEQQSVSYANGDVKLDWRIDWPARWWQLKVNVEPFGRDHATKGGSYDTGAQLMSIFDAQPPLPVPYDFVNLAGDTKKMSASKGTGVNATDVVSILPPEIVRFFMLRYPPAKRLYFDPVNVAQLIDEFAELLAKTDKTESEEQLLYVCRRGLDPVISRIPFTALVASYQAALRNPETAIDVLKRTYDDYEFDQNRRILMDEFKYIDQWLNHWAPEDIKFELLKNVEAKDFSQTEKQYLASLADKIDHAPEDADGEWFHKAVYEFKDSLDLAPKELFTTLYMALIGKSSGPRAGWFLSILPRDWLIARLRMEK